MMPRIFSKAYRIFRAGGFRGTYFALKRLRRTSHRDRLYTAWIAKYDTLTEDEREAIRQKIEDFDYQPLISILMPVYDVDERYLRAAIESVRKQIYQNWELCIADDKSPSPHVRRVLIEYARNDDRIHVSFRDENGHISAASNTALDMVQGEFTALMDHDDLLAEDALFQLAAAINKEPGANLLYSDEDKIDTNGRRFQPMFKPDWSPEAFLSFNLLTHLCAFRTETLRDVGGFRLGFEGSQDYDLCLRFIERIEDSSIVHIPLVLYHWRAIHGSVAFDSGEKTYAHERARTAIREHYDRTCTKADVIKGRGELHRTILRLETPPSVAVIAFGHTRCEFQLPFGGYNGAIKTILASEGRVFSALEEAAKESKCEVIVFVDAGAEKASEKWLEELVSRAVQPGIGAVGGCVVDSKGKVLNGGYVLGIKEGLGRAHFGYDADDPGEFVRLAADNNVSAVGIEFMAISRMSFDKAGGFDPDNTTNGLADVEVCLRLRKAGLRIVWTPWARMFTRSKPIIHEFENVRNLASKYPELFAKDPYYNPNLTLEAENLSLAFPPRVRRIDP